MTSLLNVYAICQVIDVLGRFSYILTMTYLIMSFLSYNIKIINTQARSMTLLGNVTSILAGNIVKKFV
jgi:hypothetical protein